MINSILGALPGIGDLFSAWFKSNQQNYRLLKRHSGGARVSTTGRLDFSYPAGHDRARHRGDDRSRGRLHGLSDGFGALWRIVSALSAHLQALANCRRCPAMHKPVVVGRPVPSRILLIGQAPGGKEPVLGRPFAWTAGKTLFRWLRVRTWLGRRNGAQPDLLCGGLPLLSRKRSSWWRSCSERARNSANVLTGCGANLSFFDPNWSSRWDDWRSRSSCHLTRWPMWSANAGRSTLMERRKTSFRFHTPPALQHGIAPSQGKPFSRIRFG